MAKILVEAFNLEGTTTNTFKDVNAYHEWVYEYIQTLAANNIIEGYPDGTFRSKDKVTRVEFTVLVARALDRSFR
jgi:lactocepin